MPSYDPGKTYIVEAVDTFRLRLRFMNDLASAGIIGGSFEGSPEGVEIGWGDGDFRFSTVGLFQFFGVPGTMNGWVAIGGSSLGPAVAQLQLDVALLQAQIVALQGDVGTLQAQVAVLQAQVGVLQAQVAALQAEPYITWLATATLSNDRVATTSATVAVNVAAATVTFDVPANAITNTELANMPATSVKVNPTNAVGDPQDLVAATDGFLQAVGGQIIWVPLIPATGVSDIYAEFDFTNMGNINLTTGAHVLPSVQGPTLSFTALQQGATYDILAGTGLRFRADAGNTVFTNTIAGRTAASLSFLLGDFWTAFACGTNRDYSIEVFCTLLDIPSAQTSPAGFRLGATRFAGVPVGGSADSYQALKRNNAAGSQALGSITDATANTNNYTTPAVVANTKAFGILLGSASMQAFAGDWDTGTQTWDEVIFSRNICSFNQQSTANAIWKDQSTQISIAFPTGQATADFDVDVQRLVIRSPR